MSVVLSYELNASVPDLEAFPVVRAKRPGTGVVLPDVAGHSELTGRTPHDFVHLAPYINSLAIYAKQLIC